METPEAISAKTLSTLSLAPQSRVRRMVCNIARPKGSTSTASIKPKWTIGLAPAASARMPFIAPDRRLLNVEKLKEAAATPCKPLGHAEHLSARIFCAYPQADKRKRDHNGVTLCTRAINVELVCCLLIWTWAPKLRP